MYKLLLLEVQPVRASPSPNHFASGAWSGDETSVAHWEFAQIRKIGKRIDATERYLLCRTSQQLT